MDSNSYLPVDSGNHPMWLKNIPKGQLSRVKRNCSEEVDFMLQAQIIKKKFMEEGVPRRSVGLHHPGIGCAA